MFTLFISSLAFKATGTNTPTRDLLCVSDSLLSTTLYPFTLTGPDLVCHAHATVTVAMATAVTFSETGSIRAEDTDGHVEGQRLMVKVVCWRRSLTSLPQTGRQRLGRSTLLVLDGEHADQVRLVGVQTCERTTNSKLEMKYIWNSTVLETSWCCRTSYGGGGAVHCGPAADVWEPARVPLDNKPTERTGRGDLPLDPEAFCSWETTGNPEVCDWGNICREIRTVNEQDVQRGAVSQRVLSEHHDAASVW